MHTLVYTAADRTMAQQIEAAVRQAGYALTDLTSAQAPATTGSKSALIALLSPAGLNDPMLVRTMDSAMDAGQHIIPVLVKPVAELPKSINHLSALDFSGGIDADALNQRVEQVESGAAGLPLRTRTPSVRKSNGRTALVLGAVAFFMFLVGLYAVGVLGIQAPVEEYNEIDTQVALTNAANIVPELEQYARFLPQSADDAANYESTLRAVPTVYRPFMAGTATAVSQGTPVIVPTLVPIEPTVEAGE